MGQWVLKTGPKALSIIQKWEGILDGDKRTPLLDPYLCPAGYWTIGWGHVVRSPTGEMYRGAAKKAAAYAVYPNGLTLDECKALLQADLKRFEAIVEQHVRYDCTPAQFGAMVSLSFNIGGGNFAKSSVVRHHNAKNDQAAADAFLMWNKATVNGKLTMMKGLLHRREDERALYLEGSGL